MGARTDVEVPVEAVVETLLAQGCKAVPAGADMAFLEALC